mmetsp:Transcript_17958/g.34726  ORF Transcript_17958/g.34726 Transcript_17958/m.34726 type:complete len:206 (+) Transcript_17958:729-1346(+)
MTGRRSRSSLRTRPRGHSAGAASSQRSLETAGDIGRGTQLGGRLQSATPTPFSYHFCCCPLSLLSSCSSSASPSSCSSRSGRPTAVPCTGLRRWPFPPWRRSPRRSSCPAGRRGRGRSLATSGWPSTMSTLCRTLPPPSPCCHPCHCHCHLDGSGSARSHRGRTPAPPGHTAGRFPSGSCSCRSPAGRQSPWHAGPNLGTYRGAP